MADHPRVQLSYPKEPDKQWGERLVYYTAQYETGKRLWPKTKDSAV